MKKILMAFLIIVSGILLSGCGPKTSQNMPTGVPEAKPTLFPTKPIEQSITTRPFVSLVTTTDGHWITLSIKNLTSGTTGIDYELLYMADVEGSKIERGISTSGKPVELKGATEFSKKELLGSASCTTGTCKYKYDEGVNEGTLTLKIIGPNGTDMYTSVFRIQKGSEAKETFTTGDGVFSYVSSSLPASSLYLTISSVGVPAQLSSGITPKTIPYAIFPSSSTVKAGTVSFKTSLTTGSIYAHNGKTWDKLSTDFSGTQASAKSSGQSIFILAE